ncbi:DUF4179 domain-containing protein [Paenibacillus sp. GSMTC-2017]|uniref:DUF4179 domain-containing protein n=1 Tax=Paenibacillus sp. GSMTC-2017 TaxID=2794350 RepID=UPI0018D8D7E0|nr:DUF4179 domain-containing protein [Paenibacillus sp. GSMTC-2017]MBH5318423.1 DUF4179 domain-containing protein [Paenibacillus sp. GSMTC-2017]
MNNPFEKLKNQYDEIAIPDELADVTEAAIQRGKLERERNNRRTRTNIWFKRAGASAASILVVFTISVNTMPVLASNLAQVPGLGTLVKTLQFHNGSAGGGAITDNTDINLITLQKKADHEQIVIHFEQDQQTQQIASSFNVKYSEYPTTMSLSIGGARKFSAETDLAALKESKLIKDAYQVMSFDDSLIRFNITFHEDVVFDVKEYSNPAQVIITVKPNNAEQERKSIFSVRTNSFAYDDPQSIDEEKLLDMEGLRMLRDEHGTYFVEAGYFETKAEAEAIMNTLIQTKGFTENTLFIEQRETNQIPKAIISNK